MDENFEDMTRQQLTELIRLENQKILESKKRVAQMTEVYSKKCDEALVNKSLNDAIMKLPKRLRQEKLRELESRHQSRSEGASA